MLGLGISPTTKQNVRAQTEPLTRPTRLQSLSILVILGNVCLGRPTDNAAVWYAYETAAGLTEIVGKNVSTSSDWPKTSEKLGYELPGSHPNFACMA